MSEDARAEYARRLREGLRRRPLASPIHDAVAEQMTAAAQELRRQSLQVSEQSARFKLA